MYDLKKYSLLVVDDEERALNSFKYSFGDDFSIIMAQSSSEAEKILSQKASEISIIISDHRMPNGVSGLDFLKQSAVDYPEVIKILTTAYSNHELAIEAVNSGAIYQYIVKPWKMEALSQNLLRAYELFMLRKEKKLLESERINMLERLVFTDRLRNLATLAHVLPLNNSFSALKKFITFLPPNLLSDKQDHIDSLKNLMNRAKETNRHFWGIIKNIKNIIAKKEHDFIDYSLRDILEDEGSKVSSEKNLDIKIQIDSNISEIKGEINIIRYLFDTILRYSCDSIRHPFVVTAEQSLIDGEIEVARLTFPCDFIKKKENLWNLLPIFFSVYHHSGNINIQKSQIEIFLPFSPDAITYDETEDTELLDTFFDQFEVIKHYEAWLAAI